MYNDPTMLCPCSSGLSYGTCCMIVHNDHSRAVLPEQVMRARYTAFVFNDKNYLMTSWAQETRPLTIDHDHPQTWFELKIVASEPVKEDSRHATVTFRALYASRGKITTLSERSRFVKRSHCWFYLDGEATSSSRKISSNGPCPCGSKKKFKRCCQPVL